MGRKRKSLKDLKNCGKILEILEKYIGQFIPTDRIRKYVFGMTLDNNTKLKERQDIRVLINLIKKRDIMVEGKRGYGYKLIEPRRPGDLITEFWPDRKISLLGVLERWKNYYRYIKNSSYVKEEMKEKAEDNVIMLEAVVRYMRRG